LPDTTAIASLIDSTIEGNAPIFVENYRLMDKGLGFADLHLLASTKLTGVWLWPLDQKLNQVADKLGLAP
jgi:hypothetical protein